MSEVLFFKIKLKSKNLKIKNVVEVADEVMEEKGTSFLRKDVL